MTHPRQHASANPNTTFEVLRPSVVRQQAVMSALFNSSTAWPVCERAARFTRRLFLDQMPAASMRSLHLRSELHLKRASAERYMCGTGSGILLWTTCL